MWCKHRRKRLADGSYIGEIATYLHPPYIFMTKEQYEKLRNIYSRRKGLIKIEPIEEIDNLINRTINKDWDNEYINMGWIKMDWYQYKNRIFIFRRKHKIASLVITKNTIYNPALACGGEYRFRDYDNFREEFLGEKIENPPSFVRSLNKKYYFKDDELLKTLEPEKDKITKMLKDYFDNSFERFLQESGILDNINTYNKCDIEFDINAYKTLYIDITNKIKENKNGKPN